MEVLPVGFEGRFFRIAKSGLRRLRRFRYDTPERSAFVEPAVYVCRHSDNKGPVISLVNLPLPVHPWVYYVWCGAEDCQKQCEEYTFSVRYGWPAWKAKAVARLIAKPFTALVRSAGSIPVYRNSLKVRETFRDSVEALRRGESLLIFPDVNYTAHDGDTGKLYDGFLMLEQLYYKATGAHLPFVPMHLSDKSRKLVLESPIRFRDGVPYKEEKDRVIRALHDALNNMMETYGA